MLVKDPVSITSLGIYKVLIAFQTAIVQDGFLTRILDPENDLFVRAFNSLDVSERMYTTLGELPTTKTFGQNQLQQSKLSRSNDFVTCASST